MAHHGLGAAPYEVIVIGGGVAGLACALRLKDTGVENVLVRNSGVLAWISPICALPVSLKYRYMFVFVH